MLLPDNRIVGMTCHPQVLLAGGGGGVSEALARAKQQDSLVAVVRKGLGLPAASVSMMREVEIKAVLGPGHFGGGGSSARQSLIEALQVMRAIEDDDRCRVPFASWPPGLQVWACGRQLASVTVRKWVPMTKGARQGFPTAAAMYLSESGSLGGEGGKCAHKRARARARAHHTTLSLSLCR